jgi:hypothetical protein
MNPKHFGDSYDLVKQSLLRWLTSLGAWQAHPMLTESFSPKEAQHFAGLLGVPLLSAEVLTRETDRETYFAPARACSVHVFLDPDTGVRVKKTRGRKARAYIFLDELVGIAGRDDRLLTVVFDQCLARGRECEGLETKLGALLSGGIHGFAYRSHASFLVLGRDRLLVRRARQLLEEDAHLPAARFVEARRPHRQPSMPRTEPAQR